MPGRHSVSQRGAVRQRRLIVVIRRCSEVALTTSQRTAILPPMSRGDPLERMAELRKEREPWDTDALVAELSGMAPLPPEADPSWDDDEAWDQACLLVVLVDFIAERKIAEAVPLALHRMCLGDPGESMRSLPDALASALSDNQATTRLFLNTLADQDAPPGARWWSVNGLIGLAGPEHTAALLAATGDREPMVATAAIEVLCLVAEEYAETRPAIHAELAVMAANPAGPLGPAAATAIRDLEKVKNAELKEAEALGAELRGEPIKAVTTVRRCGGRTSRDCPRNWSALAMTGQDDVRLCPVCQQSVHRCTSDEETIRRAIADEFVARDEPHVDEMPSEILRANRPKPPPLTERQERAKAWRAKEHGIEQAIRSVDADERRCPRCSYPVPSFRKTCCVCGFEVGRG